MTVGVFEACVLARASFTAISTAASASAKHSEAKSAPLAAPAAKTIALPSWVIGGRAASGLKKAPSSCQISLPPQWLKRCTTGDQPPDMATASQAISSKTAPSPACKHTETPVTRFPPFTFAIARPVSTRMPLARAALGRSPFASGRASRIAGTERPASTKAKAVR